MPRVTGSLITVDRKTGPVYFLKARDRDGRQIKRKLGPVADWPEKQAKDALRDFLTDLGRVPDRGDGSVTFDYAATAYLRYVEHDRSRAPSTVRDYRTTRPPSRAAVRQPAAVANHRAATSSNSAAICSTTLSPRTAQKTLILLHGIFRLAGRRGWMKPTPSPMPSA